MLAEKPVPAERRTPIPGAAEFPLNAWYVGAFSTEVTADKPFRRVICGKPVVFYRDGAGKPVALFDQCPHRGLPLSAGRLIGDGKIACGYHGLEFGSDGRCVRLTTPGNIPTAMRTQAFPAAEVWQWIWIWPGDPALADPALIPDHDYLKLTAPGWTSRAEMVLHWPGNYLLQLENASDALHVNYLHEGLVDDGRIGAVLPRVEHDGVSVRVYADVENTPWIPLDDWQGLDMDRDELRDRFAMNETICPSIGRFETSAKSCKSPNGPLQTIAANLATTPETMTTHWVFYAGAINFKARETEVDGVEALKHVLEQDREAFRQIQETVNMVGADHTDVSVRADERTLRVRRIIASMLQAEGR